MTLRPSLAVLAAVLAGAAVALRRRRGARSSAQPVALPAAPPLGSWSSGTDVAVAVLRGDG